MQAPHAAGVLGSLTEFWMSREWSGIVRIKDKVKRKPEDNMGIWQQGAWSSEQRVRNAAQEQKRSAK